MGMKIHPFHLPWIRAWLYLIDESLRPIRCEMKPPNCQGNYQTASAWKV